MLTPMHTWDNATASRKRTRAKRYNEESWQAGRHTPNTGISSIATLPSKKERRVQLLCSASYDIWCRDLDTDQTSTEQTCGRTDQHGKKYAQHHIQRKKDQRLGQGEDKSHRYNQQCEKNEMDWAGHIKRLKDDRWTSTCHHLETMWQEKTTRETSHAKEIRSGQILVRHDLAEDCTRQANVEAVCWGAPHAEAFAQTRDTTAAQWWMMMMMKRDGKCGFKGGGRFGQKKMEKRYSKPFRRR